jgi:hypothetical protein
VRDAESQLSDQAARARDIRRAGGYVIAGLGAAMVGLGTAGELGTYGNSDRFVSALAVATGGAYIALGIGMQFIRSEPERLWDLWTSEQGAGPGESAKRSFHIEPTVGLGSLGLTGTF